MLTVGSDDDIPAPSTRKRHRTLTSQDDKNPRKRKRVSEPDKIQVTQADPNLVVLALESPSANGGRWTPQDKELLIDLYVNKGWDWGVISRVLQRSAFACREMFRLLARERQLPRRIFKWTPEASASLLALHEKGWTYKQISRTLGNSASSCKTQHRRLMHASPR